MVCVTKLINTFDFLSQKFKKNPPFFPRTFHLESPSCKCYRELQKSGVVVCGDFKHYNDRMYTDICPNYIVKLVLVNKGNID